MYVEEWVGRLGLIEMGGVYMGEFVVEKGRWIDGWMDGWIDRWMD